MRTNEGIGVHEARRCLLCGSAGAPLYHGLRDRLFGAPGTWALMQCTNPMCRLVWLDPRPVPTDIARLYDEYFTHTANNPPPEVSRVRALVRNAVLAGRLGYGGLARSVTAKWSGKVLALAGPVREMVELSVMTLRGPANGRLLDVGCGNGRFLAMMRSLGWEVAGVEPDGKAAQVAQERFGLTVHEGTLEEAGFPDDTFDAVTMNHVIEHLWDPVATLRECRRVLKPRGRLVVVTPNIEALGYRLFREAWRGLEVPRHLYLFSMRTLRACAAQAGLRVLQLRSTARTARWMWAASWVIRRDQTLPGGSPAEPSLRLWLGGLAFQAIEHGLCLSRDAGEELVLVGKK